MVVIFRHMFGDAVKNMPHLHLGPRERHGFAKDGGAVGLGENCFRYVLADFSLVNIPSSYDMDIGRLIPAQVPMHEPDRIICALAIIGKPCTRELAQLPTPTMAILMAGITS